ncbi:MAG: N-acetyltransferase family protein, partial [Acidimicrobiales bacterium]
GLRRLEQAGRMPARDALVIRPATRDDFDAWFALFDAVAAEGRWIGAEPPCDRSVLQQDFQRRLDSPDAVTLLAEVGRRLAGMLNIELHRGVASFSMMVDARERQKGIGSRLVEACLQWATDHGAHKITCTVWPHNTPALALYRKHGFVEEARLHRHYRLRNGQLWDGVGMGLILDWESPGSPHDS